MKEIKANIQTHPFSIALVISLFNESITKTLKEGALARLEELGFNASHITVVEVPGAVEIPFAAQLLAKQKSAEVIIALGAVIRGETTHYETVCDLVSQGCQKIMLDYEIPVIFGVLTTENEAQAWDRLGGKNGHKGMEMVDSALMMHSIKHQLERNQI